MLGLLLVCWLGAFASLFTFDLVGCFMFVGLCDCVSLIAAVIVWDCFLFCLLIVLVYFNSFY